MLTYSFDKEGIVGGNKRLRSSKLTRIPPLVLSFNALPIEKKELHR